MAIKIRFQLFILSVAMCCSSFNVQYATGFFLEGSAATFWQQLREKITANDKVIPTSSSTASTAADYFTSPLTQSTSTPAILNTGDLTLDQEVCYGDLGCFSTARPWTALGRIAFLPETPSEINTEFFLYTQQNRHMPVILKAGDAIRLRNSFFDGSKPTKFIVHGFVDWGSHPWLKTMAQKFLATEDVNVFCVDWHGGSQSFYAQAAANTRVVGAEIAKMITFLSKESQLKLEGVHIIGHSLGAHIAGYVGTHFGNLGRITGMDPADPYFQNMDPLVRLDEGDADFVDVLHTDAGNIFQTLLLQGGFGTWQASGHVDVYINGGIEQPGCKNNDPVHALITDGVMEGFRWIVSCSHCRAYEFMTATIGSPCPWRSYQCDSWEEFNTGRCLRCRSNTNRSCNGVGHQAVKPSDGSLNLKYWMATGEAAPFCRYHFHVQVALSSREIKAQKGRLWIKLVGSQSATALNLVTSETILLKTGSFHDFLVTSPTDLGKTIRSVEIKWEHDAAWLDIMQWQIRTPTIYLRKVTVFSGEHQTDSVFCSHSEGLKSGTSRILSIRC